jgi:hypothetical protein
MLIPDKNLYLGRNIEGSWLRNFFHRVENYLEKTL